MSGQARKYGDQGSRLRHESRADLVRAAARAHNLVSDQYVGDVFLLRNACLVGLLHDEAADAWSGSRVLHLWDLHGLRLFHTYNRWNYRRPAAWEAPRGNRWRQRNGCGPLYDDLRATILFRAGDYRVG